MGRPAPIAAAVATALVALAGCGSSGGTAASGNEQVSAARLGRSVAHVLDASFGKGPRDIAVAGPAKCIPAGASSWRCTVIVDTASPEGDVDREPHTFDVRLTSGSCWTATETGVTSGTPTRLHGCA